jgi:hypothetical protein
VRSASEEVKKGKGNSDERGAGFRDRDDLAFGGAAVGKAVKGQTSVSVIEEVKK